MSSPDRVIRGRFLFEVTAIVVSILLAFAIDAAWESTKEHRLADEALIALRSEFETEREEVLRHGQRWGDVRMATERLLVALGEGQAPEPAVVDTLLMQFLTPTTFDPAEGTLSALISSGDIDLIGDRELRRRLSAWASVVLELGDNEIAMRQFLLNQVNPRLAAMGVPLARANAVLAGQVGRTWPSALPSDAEAGRVYAELFRSDEFEALVSTRYVWINDREYAGALEFLDDLLARIDEQLGT